MGGQLFFEGVTHDFGTVAKGTPPLKYSFKMKNIYAVDLTLSPRVSCGCTQATVSKTVLKPNEEGTLDVVLNTERINGPTSKTVFVTVGPQFISTATITLTANVRTDVVLSPGQIDFGIVARGKTPTQTMDVQYFGAQGWQLTEILKNQHAPFNLKVDVIAPQFNGARQVGYRIHASLKKDAAPGPFKEEILLKTNDPASPVLTFHIVGNVQATLTPSEDKVSFTNVAAAAPQEKKVFLRGKHAFKITRIDGMGQGISCTFEDRATMIHQLTIRCEMPTPAEVHKVLTIHTDLDNESVQIVVDAK